MLKKLTKVIFFGLVLMFFFIPILHINSSPNSSPSISLSSSLSLAVAAGLKSSKSEVNFKDAWNPKPDPAFDLILPMPCNLSMVFMAVDVPAQGFLWDLSFYMGTDDSGRPGMEYFDRKFAKSISGPFTKADLPTEWQSKLSKKTGVDSNYYLLGKYEVSNLQWLAVTGESCPKPEEITEESLKPKANVSWYDAVDFSRKYTEWLLSSAPKLLPHFKNDAKNIGYLRLPTEAEWEFAARGGSRISLDELLQDNFYSLEPGTTLNDYAVYRPFDAVKILDSPQRIGSRKPNPLGLYDMAGNVAEIMLETFHFSLGGKLHGSAGGTIRKGGSFSGSQVEIMPGYREEIPLMHERGETKNNDLGFRLVLSGINTPDGGRLETLSKEWQKLGEQNLLMEQGKNPLQELDRLIEVTQDPTGKENLSRLRGVIKDFNIELEKEKDTAAANQIRSAMYLLETIRNYAVRRSLSIITLGEHKEKLKTDSVADKKERHKEINDYQGYLQSFEAGIKSSTLFYKSRLDELAKIPEKTLQHYINLFKQEFSGIDTFNKNLKQNLDTITKHIQYAKKSETKKLEKNSLLKDILPEVLRKNLVI